MLVGACVNELRLMGVELGLISAGVTGAITDNASFARKASNVCARYLADVERALRRGCDLHSAECCQGRPAEGTPLCPVEACRRDEGL